MENINWSVFKLDEKMHLKRLIKLGQYKRLTNIDILMNPDKEFEIQKMINALEPIAVDFESKVKAKFKKTNPDGPQTPTEEAELEEKLRIEFEEYKVKMEKKRAKRLVRKDKPIKVSKKINKLSNKSKK